MADVSAEVAVVGLGAWGSQALWRLAARGVDVVGVERFGIGHAMGASHGATRLFRVACMEHPGLVPIAQRARDLWYELGGLTGQVLLRQTGGMMTGPADGHVVGGTLEAARGAGLDVEILDRETLAARLPSYAGLADDDIGVWDPAAGLTYPEAGVRAAVTAARDAGAEVLSDTQVTAIDPDDSGVTITTATGTIRAGRAIVSAGPWMRSFTDLPLVARRIPMYWFTGPEPADTAPGGRFDLAAFPVFIRELADGNVLWGHGASADQQHAVKVGLEAQGRVVVDSIDPDTVDRVVHPSDHETLSAEIAQAFPGLGPQPADSVVCMFTDSPDGQFIIGRPDGQDRIVVATGDSGHGFKHAPAIGELLAQLTLDEQPFTDITFLDPNRTSLTTKI